MMRYLTPLALSAAMLGPLGAPVAVSQEPEPPGERQMQRMRHMREMMDPMRRVAVYAPPHLLQRREALQLTDEQVTRLESLAEELRAAHEQAQSEAKQHREQLLAAWDADAPDPDEIQRLARAVMQVQQGAHLAMLGAAAEAKALLTPEQRGRVAGWLDTRGRMMRGRMHRDGGLRHQRGMLHRRPLR